MVGTEQIYESGRTRLGGECIRVTFDFSHFTMDHQRYTPFDIDKGADKLFFIGTAFMIFFLFLM